MLITSCLESNKKLKSIEIKCMHIDGKAVELICQQIVQNKELTHLKSLKLSSDFCSGFHYSNPKKEVLQLIKAFIESPTLISLTVRVLDFDSHVDIDRNEHMDQRLEMSQSYVNPTMFDPKEIGEILQSIENGNSTEEKTLCLVNGLLYSQDDEQEDEKERRFKKFLDNLQEYQKNVAHPVSITIKEE
eukprot:g6902.t1